MKIIFVLCMLAAGLFAGAIAEKKIDILVSGESHAMLLPCDCPDSPDGGFARRSGLVKMWRERGAVLLLDAGGFGGGGIYDMYTQGRAADSLRTLAALKAMAAMGYDAVGIGDDDLIYGGEWLAARARENNLALVSANCRFSDSSLCAAPYLIVKKDGVRYGITGVLTQEKLFDSDTAIRVDEPVAALKKIWDELESGSDVRIIISHLGEEDTRMLADSFPRCDLMVNGHRKSAVEPLFYAGNIPVLQFGFQGKTLASAVLTVRDDGIAASDPRWLEISEDIPGDSAVAHIVSSVTASTGGMRYDLYIMSRCPYGLDALGEFAAFIRQFPAVEWDVWFVGTIDDSGIFSSLHGPDEVEEEKRWLAVKALYPDRWLDFLEAAARTREAFPVLAGGFGMDTGRLEKWSLAAGDAELAVHYRRSSRLGIDASPTLTDNNIPASFAVTRQRLARVQCLKPGGAGPACDSLPECLDDSDCRRPGMVGTCSRDTNGNRCGYRPAKRFTFTVVTHNVALSGLEKSAVERTKELFPGARIEVLDYAAGKGKRIVERLKPSALPLFLFEKNVAQAANYERIRSGLISYGEYLTFKEGIMRAQYYYRRAHIPGSALLFVDPFFPGAADVLRIVLDDTASGSMLEIKPVFYDDPSLAPPGAEERQRREESHRWLALARHFQENFRAYLRYYARNPGSSYWNAGIEEAGIGLKSFTDIIARDTTALHAHFALLRELAVDQPIAMLVDNRELVVIGGKRELLALLDRIR